MQIFSSRLSGILKAGSLDGKKWRERAKLISFCLKMLEPVGLDAALESALPVAFKTKPTDRGSFAEKAWQDWCGCMRLRLHGVILIAHYGWHSCLHLCCRPLFMQRLALPFCPSVET